MLPFLQLLLKKRMWKQYVSFLKKRQQLWQYSNFFHFQRQRSSMFRFPKRQRSTRTHIFISKESVRHKVPCLHFLRVSGAHEVPCYHFLKVSRAKGSMFTVHCVRVSGVRGSMFTVPQSRGAWGTMFTFLKSQQSTRFHVYIPKDQWSQRFHVYFS